jgi:hypothetical protein
VDPDVNKMCAAASDVFPESTGEPEKLFKSRRTNTGWGISL